MFLSERVQLGRKYINNKILIFHQIFPVFNFVYNINLSRFINP